MIRYTKIMKYLKKPHIAFVLIGQLLIWRIKNLFYKLLNPRSKINRSVKFDQKTVLSGQGTIDIHDNVRIGYKMGGYYWNGVSEFQSRYPDSKILIKRKVAINNSCLFIAANSIIIDEETRIGANVLMMDFEAHGTDPINRNKVGEIGEIKIGKNVWIGNNVIILKNVSIGDNSIIAAGSVVLKGDYPENSIIGGNPAHVIKKTLRIGECLNE